MSVTTIIDTGIRKEKCLNTKKDPFVLLPHQENVKNYFVNWWDLLGRLNQIMISSMLWLFDWCTIFVGIVAAQWLYRILVNHSLFES
jgi:hypothetical protein